MKLFFFFQLEYEAHPVQMELLRIDSERMSQNVTMVTYHCQTKKPKLRVLYKDEHTLGTNLLREIEDECCKSTRMTDDSDREFHRRPQVISTILYEFWVEKRYCFHGKRKNSCSRVFWGFLSPKQHWSPFKNRMWKYENTFFSKAERW